jgi:heme-degrading monooxygenase HmoA
MILEVATLNVRAGQEPAFEEAMRRASPLIEASPGFAGMNLRRCLETPNRYQLSVKWQEVEDHTLGFRQSERYQQWRELLHHFYDPPPTVEHYGEALPI